MNVFHCYFLFYFEFPIPNVSRSFCIQWKIFTYVCVSSKSLFPEEQKQRGLKWRLTGLLPQIVWWHRSHVTTIMATDPTVSPTHTTGQCRRTSTTTVRWGCVTTFLLENLQETSLLRWVSCCSLRQLLEIWNQIWCVFEKRTRCFTGWVSKPASSKRRRDCFVIKAVLNSEKYEKVWPLQHPWLRRPCLCSYMVSS